MINWEEHRNPDGTLDLSSAYTTAYGKPSARVRRYFRDLESLQPIQSRQTAAVAIAAARSITTLAGVVGNYVS